LTLWGSDAAKTGIAEKLAPLKSWHSLGVALQTTDRLRGRYKDTGCEGFGGGTHVFARPMRRPRKQATVGKLASRGKIQLVPVVK